MPNGPDRSCSHGRGDRTLPEVRCHSHFAQCPAPTLTPGGLLLRSVHSRARSTSGSSTPPRAATSGICARLPAASRAASPADRMDSPSRFRARFRPSREFGWIWSTPGSPSRSTRVQQSAVVRHSPSLGHRSASQTLARAPGCEWQPPKASDLGHVRRPQHTPAKLEWSAGTSESAHVIREH
jgi:hypothetical protein